MMQANTLTFDEIAENFELLDDWEDRYRYIIELGRTLEPLRDDERNVQTKVPGCASQVWLVSDRGGGVGGSSDTLHFRGDSDAHIVRGLIALVLALYSGKVAIDILAIDEKAGFARLGLNDHLTAQRSNGLASMIGRIKADAAAK